ncbi:MAG: gamma-glutamylcyclotransferase [Deltaproteobacteria bacterium]|nr:gamma-glutamylcyclotransferase [Deltaproteobacteria bacterium]MCB2186315.1 gamma-glutamylcyclotransferase [Deltaproteobacteria bacterium]
MPTRLPYFAYGSNLLQRDLRRWCREHGRPYPLKAKLANAYLPDHESVFDIYSRSRRGGVLDVQPRLGQAVPGVLFEMEPEGWLALDQKEGTPRLYERMEVQVIVPGQGLIPAVTYRSNPVARSEKVVPPSKHYLQVVREGLAEHGLEDQVVVAVAKGHTPPYLIPRIFVYGTLLEGQRNHHFITADRHIAPPQEARLPGLLYDFGAFPGYWPEKDGWVWGQLWEVDDLDEILVKLDVLEGFYGWDQPDNFYRRELREVELAPRGGELLAWTYCLCERPLKPAIKSGDWRRR